MVSQDRTVVLTIYRSDRRKAKSDVGRTDQNGSKKTRRVKPLRLSRYRSRTCPIEASKQMTNDGRDWSATVRGVEK